jgi:phage shock protein PspC (stress-responsive transcriptional regulator)
MDKITRIHLAKIPYEIGINAQVELKKYLDEIRGELDADLADEIMADIEVRVTEILGDRNIKRNGVITAKDIDAVREQLGSPEQFTDSEITGQPKIPGPKEARKLLRDTDGAYIGGVASGIGAYFAIDPIFVRLAFVALTFLSGLGVVLYLLLWLLVPAAKTSSDKLLMRGEPVTAAALQHYRGTAGRTIANLKLRSALRLFYKILRVLFTAGAALFILGLLSAIGFGSAVLYTQPLRPLYVSYHLNYLLLALIWLFTMTITGLVIVVLLRLWRQRSASLKSAFVTLAGVLVLTLAGIAIVTPFIVSHYKDQYGGDKLATAIAVHNDTASTVPTSLDLSADSNLIVSYVITSQPPRATYQAYPGMGQPKLSIVNKNGIISVRASQLSQVVPSCVLDWCQHTYLPVRVTLYGPALQKFTADGGAELDLGNLVQTNLALTARNNSNLNIDNSYSDNLSLSAESGASISAPDTTAQIATVSVQNNSNVFGPASSSLNANLPKVCDQTLLLLSQTPTSLTINGQPVTTQAFSQNNCVSVDNPPPFAGDRFRYKHGRNLESSPVPSVPPVPKPGN